LRVNKTYHATHLHRPGKERIHTWHNSGTSIEIGNGWTDAPKGTKVQRIQGDDYEICHGNKYVYIKGTEGLNLVVQGKVNITVVGGLAIILQDIRDRATLDIDVAPTKDAAVFQELCNRLGVPVDIITVASTVDLVHTSTVNMYAGNFLSVNSVKAKDLIRLKLERFYKQDPEDIYAIIDKINLSYEAFKMLVCDMLIDFIGNPRNVLLSAFQVVEIKYPDHAREFELEMKI